MGSIAMRVGLVCGCVLVLGACGNNARRSMNNGFSGSGGTGGVGAFGGVGGTGGLGGTGGTGGVGAVGGTGGDNNDAGALDAAMADATTPVDAGGGSYTEENPPTMPPDSGCTVGVYNGHGYWFCEDNLDWDEARAACMAIGGDLLSINDEAEQTYVAERIDAIGGTQWLVGLNQKNASGQGVDGTWQWVDGSDPAAGYNNWGSGEPDSGDCAIMNSSGVWQDFSCGNGENWVCELH